MPTSNIIPMTEILQQQIEELTRNAEKELKSKIELLKLFREANNERLKLADKQDSELKALGIKQRDERKIFEEKYGSIKSIERLRNYYLFNQDKLFYTTDEKCQRWLEINGKDSLDFDESFSSVIDKSGNKIKGQFKFIDELNHIQTISNNAMMTYMKHYNIGNIYKHKRKIN